MGSNLEKLGFEGLIPNGKYSYGYMSNYDGYGGFDFKDMEIISKKCIEEQNLEDTGFWNVLHGKADTFTIGEGAPMGLYSWMVPAEPGATFNLKSGIFAAALANNYFSAEFYPYGPNGEQQGSLSVSLNETATTINFSKYGNEFKDMGELLIVGYSYRESPILVMDNLVVHLNAASVRSTEMPVHLPSLHRHVPHAVTHAMAQPNFGNQNSNHTVESTAGSFNDHHSELTSLAAAFRHDDLGGLTAQFALPQFDHFGT